MTDTVGPVDFLLVSFPGNRFNGDVAPALAELVDSGTIRILDLLFITKDAEGTVSFVEFAELEDDILGEVDGEIWGVLSDEDAHEAGALLEPNSSAAVLVYENTWAARFAAAVRGSGGQVVEHARVPRETIEAALAAVADN